MIFQMMELEKCTFSGHKELDDQQTEFVERGNIFLRAYNIKNHQAITESTITYLSDYTRRHFVTQEAFMQLHNYPGIEKHVAHHSEYVREVAKGFKTLLKCKNTNDKEKMDELGMHVCLLIMDWFEFHILKADKRLNDFIRYEVHTIK